MFGNLCFPLVLGKVMYANEVETSEKRKLPEIKDNIWKVIQTL